MNKGAYHILRLGLSITFIWIGIMILGDPEGWAILIDDWAANLIPFDLNSMMISAGILDIVIGVFLLINRWTWLAALIGGLHMLAVLITVGIDAVTVRNIGLVGASFALFLEKKPNHLTFKK